MADKIYQLPYDDEIDKDISDWLKSLPRARKAEMVRNAIRFYLQASQGSNVIAVNPSPIMTADNNEKTSRKRSNILPKDGDF